MRLLELARSDDNHCHAIGAAQNPRLGTPCEAAHTACRSGCLLYCRSRRLDQGMVERCRECRAASGVLQITSNGQSAVSSDTVQNAPYLGLDLPRCLSIYQTYRHGRRATVWDDIGRQSTLDDTHVDRWCPEEFICLVGELVCF